MLDPKHQATIDAIRSIIEDREDNDPEYWGTELVIFRDSILSLLDDAQELISEEEV